MKQQLFEITPTPNQIQRHNLARAELRSFRRQHNILTHRCGDMAPGCAWLAVLVQPSDQGKSIAEIMSESSRTYEESGWSHEDRGELSAVRGLCERNAIQGCP